MTERGRPSVERSRHGFGIGPSALDWRGDHLEVLVDEVATPWPRRVQGRVRVYPSALSRFATGLDRAGRHRWGPIAPCARIEVDLPSPGLRWQGHAYLDSNEGDEPVAAAFALWDWSRATLRDGSTVVVYDVREPDASESVVAERFRPDGTAEPIEPAARQRLPRTGWGIGRSLRSDGESSPPRVVATLEDTPFYTRSVLRAPILGETVETMHETLDGRRLAAPWVQALLPFRMPRRR